MKKLLLYTFLTLAAAGVNAQDLLFSFDVDNTDPTVSVVELYVQFDGSGNANAAGITGVFYYDAAEATSVLADVDYSPLADLGWDLAGNTTYSNIVQDNPNVPTVHTNRIEVGALDGLFTGTNFSTTPTLLLTITFNKNIGTPEQGGDVYIGATGDTDPAITYFDSGLNGYDIVVTGDRQAVLPVTLVGFTAQKFEEKSARLRWFTSDETNTSHFEVERSTNGIHWNTIGEVKAATYSTQLLSYEFIDENVYNGRDKSLNVYYRLKMLDLDDRYKYSPIDVVNFSNSDAITDFSAWPNPAKEGVTIEWDSYAAGQPTLLEVFDAAGKQVYSRPVAHNSNQEYIDFAQAGVHTGHYLVRILSGDEILDVKQIIVGQN